jgi:transcriptional regulator with XRE-family HTH domain
LKVNEAFGYIINLRRSRLGLTLRQLSEKANVSLGYLSEVERGKKEASSEIIESISYALDIPSYVIVQEAGALMANDQVRLRSGWELELDNLTAKV